MSEEIEIEDSRIESMSEMCLRMLKVRPEKWYLIDCIFFFYLALNYTVTCFYFYTICIYIFVQD